MKFRLKQSIVGRNSHNHVNQLMRYGALAIGLTSGATVAAATNFITAPNLDLATSEDTSIPVSYTHLTLPTKA